MKRRGTVGIMTMHRVQNFGSILQAYALYSVVKNAGYICEIIDYQYPNDFHFSKNVTRQTPSFFCSLYQRVKFVILYRRKKQKDRFNTFINKYLSLSDYFASPDAIRKFPPKYDIYLTGSDQVWNPRCMKGDSVFFFDFTQKDDYKISYASSFSVKQIPDHYKQQYKKHLSLYSKVSVREESGVRIISELTGMISEIVCDPTLLLTKADYAQLAGDSAFNIQKEYILVYALTYAYNPYPKIEEVIEMVKRELGIPVIYLHSNAVEKYHFGSSITSAGPNEFVNLFINAKFVITSSFHGTAFAINFGIPFFSIVPDKSIDDDRIMSLLRIVGLEDRGISLSKQLCGTLTINMEYDDPHRRLNEYRNRSLTFLYNALNKSV